VAVMVKGAAVRDRSRGGYLRFACPAPIPFRGEGQTESTSTGGRGSLGSSLAEQLRIFGRDAGENFHKF
jgi:hypothetical protein